MTQAIFLSYASQDADAARRICDALRAAGLEVWFDQSELRGGDAWDQSIRKQIKECALFVPLISANTDARPEGYFRLEWKLAVDRSHLMADDQPFFVPVMLDDLPEPNARVPERFRERQWTRLKDDATMAAFAERVGKLLDGRGLQSLPRTRSGGESGLKSAPDNEFGTSVSATNIAAPLQNGAQVSSQEHAESVFRSPETSADPGRSLSPSAVVGDRDDSVKHIAPLNQPAQLASGTRAGFFNRTSLIAIFAAMAILASAATAWVVVERQRKEAFVTQSLNKIEDLSRSTKYMEAYRLAVDVERAGASEKLTDAIRENFTRAVEVSSTPEGATIAFREYKPQANDAPWIEIGAAPLTKIRVPRGVLEWRATLPQKQTHTLAALTTIAGKLAFSLPDAGSKEAEMVPVPSGKSEIGGVWGLRVTQGVPLSAFSIDRTEVTNRQFAAFVKAGGYTRAEFWREPFRDGARTLSFAEAITRFKDATGQTGPANWRLGSHSEGEGDLPVRGISWHEANAYAAFAGKSLPSLYHWYFADSANDFFTLMPALMPSANFEATSNKAGPRAAATSRMVSRFGAIDMAGNLREWIANPTDMGTRVAVGGSWQDVSYQYKYASTHDAFERPLDVGFRLMSKLTTGADEAAFATVRKSATREAKANATVSDAEYAIYRRMLGDGTTTLDVRIEATDTTRPHWTRIKVNYAAGYGGERMNAYLYLPRNAAPPFQTVIYMPGSSAFEINKSFDEIGESGGAWSPPEMLIRGGRAVLYPVWKSSFERSVPLQLRGATGREMVTRWASELRQSVAFLRTRQEVDAGRIGYFGFSLGTMFATAMLVTEQQVKTAIFLAGGLDAGGGASDVPYLPEIDAATYAPRLKIPVLMLNGREDIRFPYETSQVPYFNLLGSPPGKKKHKTYPGGHGVLGWYDDLVRDSHDWLDKQFGPVKPIAQGATK